jgi:MoaA/NifB/PqqE/SkfB family radical SAM enzyme
MIEVDPKALALYFLFTLVPKGYSLVKGEDDYRIERFKGFKHLRQEIDYANLDEQYKRILIESVRSLLPKDPSEPVGLLLSGGIDSTIILHCLREVTERPIYTVTATYNKNSALLKRINTVAKKYRTIHENIIVGPSSVKDLPLIMKHFSQPTCDGALTLTHQLMAYLSDKVRVVFSGEGDFLLGNSNEVYINKLKRKFISLDRKTKLKTVARLKQQKFFREFINSDHGYDFCEPFSHEFVFVSKNELLNLFSSSHKQLLNQLNFKLPKTNSIRSMGPKERDIFYSAFFLVENLNTVTSTIAKMHHLIPAFPFLTKEHFSFCNSLDADWKLRHYSKKALIAQAFRNDIPEEIISIRVNPTGPDYENWLNENNKLLMKSVEVLKELELLDYTHIRKLLDNPEKYHPYKGYKIVWSLLCLGTWLKARNIIKESDEKTELKGLTIHYDTRMKCNCNCIMCDRYRNIKENKNQFDTLMNFSKYFDPDTVSRIKILGGESLLELDKLCRLLEAFTSKGYGIDITTNGTLLKPRVIEKLIGSGLRGITISLDSLDEKVHDSIRNYKGAYAACVKAMDYLRKHHPDFRIEVNIVVMNKNIKDIIKTIMFVKERGARQINLLSIAHDPENYDKIKVSKKDLKDLESKITKLVLENPEYRDMITYDFHGRRMKCRYLFRRIQINEHGEIYPCELKMVEGLKLNRSLKDVIKSDKFQEFLHKMGACEKNCCVNPIKL